MVKKIEKLPTDLFAETVRFVTLCGQVQWEEKNCATLHSSYLHIIIKLFTGCGIAC